MPSNSLVQRGLRKLWALYPKKFLASQKSWRLLKSYPAITPTDALLQKWNASRWEEYQRWINNHSLQSVTDWSTRQQNDLHLPNPPKISIVTPVYNTASDVLYQCLLSVRMQTYPYWQWILVDDGSTRPETLAMLRSGVCSDPRIQVIFGEKTQGISAATNIAIRQATGDYVAFLDHDDRLSLEALSLIAREILNDPQIDILYSDRDMLSPEGDRFLHLFKPDWSPETLLSGNYIFHLMCYKRQLLTELQGLRSEYDGSQDYDLILRASETQPKVQHIPKVLYHWRQHGASVALNADSKNYAFEAGLKALNATLQHRGIQGEATEIPGFWKGTYQLNLALPRQDSLQVISLNALQCHDQYAAFITDEIKHKNQPAQRYIAIISDAVKPEHSNTLMRLTAWLQLDQVGLASGKVIDSEGKLVYIGMDYN
ncbi:MAG: glycosyltransferase, partial [Methylococcaceae bacterium]|nr:glycosyltransferase [Methylococcaceae bacterium]